MRYAFLLSILLLSSCKMFDADLAPGDKQLAYIYENRETGKLLYCSNDEGNNVRDFRYVGTATVKKSEIVYCKLEK